MQVPMQLQMQMQEIEQEGQKYALEIVVQREGRCKQLPLDAISDNSPTLETD